MEWIIGGYFVVNAFGAGYFFYEKLEFACDKADRVRAVFSAVIVLFFGLPITVAALVYTFFEERVTDLQIKFWFQFLFTKTYHDVPLMKLKSINEWSSKQTGFRGKMCRIGVNAINKRNKYFAPTGGTDEGL